MTHLLSVVIPCKDERSNIRACIESVREIADEILVADSGSTDGTLDIIRDCGGCRIVEREYVNSGDFKNWAIPQATHEWVLLIDADERVTSQVTSEIRGLLKDGPQATGYWLPRTDHFMGHPVRYSGWQNSDCLRLFRRDLARYAGDTDHAEIEIASGKVGRLQSPLTHYTYCSYDQLFRKMHRYTTYQAEVWHRQGKRSSLLKLVFTGPLRFVRSYFINRGFLDGVAGFQVCALTAFYSFMKQARLWELHATGPTKPS